MCGIAGVWRPGDAEDDRPRLASVLAAMRSRGPDAEGQFREGPLTLGHRRLAILDLGESGRQPMTSRSGRYVVALNGEIYNFRDLRAELDLDPRALRSSGDTEVLLAAWERWGPGCLDRLVGPFAFALYDRRDRRLWLVRDRVGEKPLFHLRAGNVVAFASSLAALLRFPWAGRRIDPDALAEYVSLRYVLPPRTIVEGARKLRPGHLLEIDEGGVRERRWWRPPLLDPLPRAVPPSRGEAVEEFDGLLEQACRRCLVSDVPVALLLSDGIDSNAIRSVLRRAGGLRSYTFRSTSRHSPPAAPGPDEETEDREVGYIDADPRAIAAGIEPVFSSLTEPVGDGSIIPTWLMIRAARRRATVFLCGQGGDEILGGYRMSQDRFRLAALRWIARLPAWVSDPAVRHWIHCEADGPTPRRRVLAASSRDDWPAAVPYLVHRPLGVADAGQLAGDEVAPMRGLASILGRYAECGPGMSDLDRMQYVLLETFFAADILPLADSVSMATSAEMRLPFVDRDLMDFVLRLPRRLRVSRLPGHANTKQVLRAWARGRLPSEIVRRRKRTFRYGSIRHLLSGPEACIRERILDAPFLRDSLAGLEPWVGRPAEFFHGAREGTLWALLALATWGAAVGVQPARAEAPPARRPVHPPERMVSSGAGPFRTRWHAPART